MSDSNSQDKSKSDSPEVVSFESDSTHSSSEVEVENPSHLTEDITDRKSEIEKTPNDLSDRTYENTTLKNKETIITKRNAVQAFFMFFALSIVLMTIMLKPDGFDVNYINLFIHIPSILFVFGLTVSLTFMIYPINDVLNAYKVGLNALEKDHPFSSSDLYQAEVILKLISKLYIGTGMGALLIGMMYVFANIDHPKQIGPMMAFSLLSSMLGIGFAEFVNHPFVSRIQFRRAQDQDETYRVTTAESKLSDMLIFVFVTTVFIFVLFQSFITSN